MNTYITLNIPERKKFDALVTALLLRGHNLLNAIKTIEKRFKVKMDTNTPVHSGSCDTCGDYHENDNGLCDICNDLD